MSDLVKGRQDLGFPRQAPPPACKAGNDPSLRRCPVDRGPLLEIQICPHPWDVILRFFREFGMNHPPVANQASFGGLAMAAVPVMCSFCNLSR